MVKFTKIKTINNIKGNIIKFISENEINLKKIREIYFSEVYKGKNKGWKFHENRNQIMSLINGTIIFYYKKKNNSKIKKKKISFPKNLFRIHIPKKTYYSFKCVSAKKAIIINLIDEKVK